YRALPMSHAFGRMKHPDSCSARNFCRFSATLKLTSASYSTIPRPRAQLWRRSLFIVHLLALSSVLCPPSSALLLSKFYFLIFRPPSSVFHLPSSMFPHWALSVRR